MALAGSNRVPALTAAASKIRYDRSTPTKLKDADWQVRAWTVYDKLGAVYYMTRYRAHIARKIEYFAALDEVGQDPQLDDGPASKVLENEGGPELIRRLVSELMVHWDVAGEAYLVRYDEEPLWRILSTQELSKTQNGSFIWGDELTKQGEIDPDNVFRVWQPHPRMHWEADSPTRHILDDAEELILSSREIKARTLSRLSAGILWLPDSVDISPFGADTDGDPDTFADELIRRMSRPISDPGSADSIAPWVVTANKDDIEAARHMTFAREWDVDMELREESRRNIALGLDLPPELGTGAVGDVNHWGAWWISDEAVNTHVTPTVDDILDSLTVNWFRPTLETAGVSNAQNFVLWRDVSPATVTPDRSEVALKMFELGALSGEALRRVTDFDEDDAPQGETPQPVEDEIIIEREGPPIQAAVGSFAADTPARIDADLFAWLVEASHQEIERLFELTLAKQKRQRKTVTAAVDVDESMIEKFLARVDRRISQAQEKVGAWLTRLVGPVAIDWEPLRLAAVAAIGAAVLQAVRNKLFTPQATPDPIDLGELPEVSVPVNQLRDALSLAGGGLPFAEGERAWEMIGNGKEATDLLNARGYRTLSYRWDYRDYIPRQTFPPHKALDGEPLDSWEDDKLMVTGNFPRRSHYKPGDHDNCQCLYTRILTLSLTLPVAAAL